jgi:hypothetical protein
MTGGRAYVYDPSGRHTAALDDRSVVAVRLASALAARPDGQGHMRELTRLLEAHRSAGSTLAGRLLDEVDVGASFWLIEPVPVGPSPAVGTAQPDRNPIVSVPAPIADPASPTLDRAWGTVTSG